jgi:hypothetical protein
VGWLQVWLESYRYPGFPPKKVLPKNELASGDRMLRMSCEIKAIGGEHDIVFLVKGDDDPQGVHLASRREKAAGNEWTPVEAYFRFSPAKNCRLRIDDRIVSAPNSSVQIRGLVLAERVTTAPGAGVRA